MSLGNDASVLKARQAGVRTASDGTGNSGRGTPSTVTHVTKAECVFVGYNDERGNRRAALFFKVGDEYYAPKDTVSWCESLLPMTDWIKDGVEQRLKAAAPVDVPTEDAVNVLGDPE